MAQLLLDTTDHQMRAGLCLGLGLLRATEHGSGDSGVDGGVGAAAAAGLGTGEGEEVL